MVFESLVADLLNKYLGEYVENLDKSQLNIGIWGGNVTLRDLTLKQSALDDLNLPVKTVRGYLGQLVLQIPWKNLYTAPVIATIERLYLLVVPNQSVKYDKQKEEKWAEEAKQAELQKIEDAKKALKEKDKAKPDNTFVEKLAAQIIKNVQVSIKDIHIRYEDRITTPERPFALGVTLSSLDVVTIPSWGDPVNVDPVNLIFKELSIQCLSVYWNSNTMLFSEFSTERYLTAISDGIASKTVHPAGYKYMLGPINSSAKLRINKRPEIDGSHYTIPKHLLKLDLERLLVQISKAQYQDLSVLLETMDRMSRAALYRKYRPNVPCYRGHYKKWWKFAYTAILEEEIRRRKRNWDWAHMLNHRLLCKRYADAYKAKLMSPKPTAEVLSKCTELERELDTLNIVLIREQVELEVEREGKKTEEVKKENQGGGWFSGWWGGSGKATSPQADRPIVKQFEKAMTKDEKDKLYQAIGYQEGAAVAIYPESFVEVDIGVTLHSLELEIINEERKVNRVLVAAFHEVSTRLQQRPSAQALKVSTSIERFSVLGCQQGEVLPQLVITKTSSKPQEVVDATGHLFKAMFETKPLDKTCDQRLQIMSSPLQVIYDAFTINSVVEVFTTKHPAVVQQLQAAASTKLAEIKEKSASGLQHMIQQHTILDLKVDMSASHVLIPRNGFYIENENPMIVVNLGRIQVSSKPRGTKKNVREMYSLGTSDDEILQEMRSQSYDNFLIQLSDLQVLFAQPGEYWEEGGKVSNTHMYILKPTTLNIELSKCIITDDPRLPKIKIIGHLPSVTFSVAEKRMLGMISLLLSIPLPESQEPPEEELKVTHYGSMTSLQSLNLAKTAAARPKKSPMSVRVLAPDEELVQFTELEVMFVLKDLSLYLMVEDEETDSVKPLLEFHMLKLEAEMVQQTFDMKVVLRLGGLSLVQSQANNKLQIVNTPMASGRSDYLFVVTYINVNKNSPEFHTKYLSVLQLIEIDFTKLDVFIHLEAMLDLMNWSNRVNKYLESTKTVKKPMPSPDKVSSKIKPIMKAIKEEGSVLVKSAVKARPRMRVEVVDLKVTMKVGEISMALGANICGTLCSLGVSGGETSVIMKKSYTQIDAKLQGIYLLDHLPSTSYKQILSVLQKEEALVANVVMFSEEGKAMSKVDMSVKASMACFRFVFLNRFIMSLLDFLNNFQAAQLTLIEASHAAAEAAKHNVQTAYQKAFRIQLDVSLKAPIIIIPASSKSFNGVMLDLGHLTVQNTLLDVYTKTSEEPAVLDRLQIDLQKLKLARVQLSEDDLQLVNENLILEDISFKLTVQRNLSSGWFTEAPDLEVGGRLHSIRVKLSQADYAMMMSILEENLGEKSETVLRTVEPKQETTKHLTVTEDLSHVQKGKGSTAVLEIAEKLTTQTKFTLTLDSLIIDLVKINAENEEEGLARFTLYVISVKGRMLSDGSLQTSLLLLDCMLDDTRPSQLSKITRYMERKKERTFGINQQDDPSDRKSMIDITYQQKADAMFVDVRVCSFNLILNMQLLLKIGSFFTVEKKPLPVQPVQKLKNIRPALTPTQSDEDEISKVMTINLKLEHPDIILVENLDDINTSALLLHMELTFKMRVMGKHQTMTGSVNDLQLFSCCYNPQRRNQTKAPVLRPVTIVLAGSTPDGSGLHVDLSTTKIQLSVSPDTIQLLNSVYSAISKGSKDKTEESVEDFDHGDMWDIETFNESDYSFLKTEMGEEAVTGDEVETKVVVPHHYQSRLAEVCVFSAPSIVLTVEVGVGKTTVPMLLLQSSIQATVKDWSSQLSVESHVCLEVSYYNNTLALWEPLIEPVETNKGGKTTFIPWELSLQVDTAPPGDDATSDVHMTSIASDTSNTSPKSLMMIHITSSEILPITVTKTCLEVLKQLGASFTDAIFKPTEQRSGQMAQFVLKNDTGLSIALLLNNSDFKLFSSGEMVGSSGQLAMLDSPVNEIREVVLDSGAHVELSSTYEHSLGLQSTAVEKYIRIKVPEYDCNLDLPVIRADKRFFLLNHRGAGNDPWGLVSDVKVNNGCTIITLRSIIQVENHFTVPVSVYFMTKKGNELQLIGTVGPKQHINLPLHSIYTPTNELFFSVEGYTVSVVPYVWKDLQKTLEKTTLMQCNPRNLEDKEPFFIKAIGEIEQVYFELSTRHTMSSTCYNIHIRPTVILKNFLPVEIVCCIQGIAADKPVKSGEHIQIPTAEPGTSSIVIRIIGYLDKEWCCKQEIAAVTASSLSVWTFECYESPTRTTLDLGMHTIDRNGSLVMALYCPFWMLNKTGLMLSYRPEDSNNVLYHPADYKGPIMFSFKAKTFFAKKKSCIRVETGSWSDKFSLDVAGSSGSVTCKYNNKVYQIGVNIQLTYNTLTKQVMFTPFFVLINNCPITMLCQEVGTHDEPWIPVEPQGCASFWPVSKEDDGALRVRIINTEETSIPFYYKKVHNTLLKLQNKYGALNVDVQITEGAVYIALYSYEPGMAPALIINHTDMAIDFYDKSRKDNVRTLNPSEKVLFCWESVEENHQLIWLNGKYTNNLREDGIGDFTVHNKENVYFWVSFLYGLQRVLLFTNVPSIAHEAQNVGDFDSFTQEIEISIHGIGVSLVDNLSKVEVLYIGITSSGIVWECKKHSKKRYKALSSRDSELIEYAYNQYMQKLAVGDSADPRINVDPRITVDFETMQLLKPSHKEMRRTYNTGLWLHICSSVHQYQLHAKINRIQIDNQMFDCVFPVVLSPVPPPKSISADSIAKPFIEVSIVKRVNDYSAVQQYKYFKILIQEFHVKVDIGFINALVKLFEAGELSEKDEVSYFTKDKALVKKPLLALVALSSSQEQKNFYDILHLSPLKIHVSFSLSSGGGHPSSVSSGGEGGSQQESGGSAASGAPPFLSVLMQSFGVTLTDIQDVVFKLSYFERQYSFLTQKQLMSEAQMHYVGQLVKQLYVLVFGLDVLGNPYGLVLGFTQGAADLFYEPFQGAIQGPGEFAEGLVLGVRSLFGHTVGGAAGAVSRITGAMGKGLAALTFDKEYQRHRREAMNKRPANMQEGLARSGKGLVMGVVEGIGGVITKPISGAKDEGVQGFFKGVGKGMVGLVTRPTAGFVDFAAGSFNAVKRATELNEEVTRMRTPRHFKVDGLVRPYSKLEAEGNKLLMDLEKGRFTATDAYIFHMSIGSAKNKDMLLITDQRIAYLCHNEIFGGYQMDWSYTWQDMSEPPKIVDNGIAVSISDKKKGMRGFFSSSDAGKVLLIKDPEIQKFIVDTITELMQKVKNPKLTISPSHR